MNEEEQRLFEMTGEIWNEFSKLPERHPADQTDVVFHIHAIQNIILSRAALRQYNEKKQSA